MSVVSVFKYRHRYFSAAHLLEKIVFYIQCIYVNTESFKVNLQKKQSFCIYVFLKSKQRDTY